MKKITAVITALTMIISSTAAFAEEAVSAQKEPIKIYVSTKGLDSNRGTQEAPLKTIAAARNAVRKLTKDRPIEVLIEPGEYPLDEGIRLENMDSGTKQAPITYKKNGEGEVLITGAKKIDISKFKSVTDEKILERLPASSRGRVGQVDLGAQGFSLDELTLRDSNGNSIFGANVATPRIMGLYLNDREQQLAKWPNRNFLTITGVISSDTFEYTQVNPSKWTKAKDAFIHGYMYSEWTGGWMPIEKIDTDERTITARTGGATIALNHRWGAINLLEELDIPGEWYLDRDSLTLYYYPERYLNEKTDVLEFGILRDTAIKMANCEYITLDGLTIAKTYGIGIDVDGGHDITVKNCYVHDICGGEGMLSRNYPKNIVFENNTVANTVGRGMAMEYNGWGPYPQEEIDDLVYTGNIARNNHIYNAGNNAYGMVFLGTNNGGIGSSFEYNTIHKGINSGIGSGEIESTIRYNEIYNCVRETADAGAIYVGRTWKNYGVVLEYNYIHDLGDKEFQAGNLVDCIFWDDTMSGQTARYNILRPNSKTRTYGVVNGGGRDMVVTGNIILDSDQSISMQDRSTFMLDIRDWQEDAINHNSLYQNLQAAVARKGTAYQKKYPEMARALAEIDESKYIFYPNWNVITNNVIVNAQDINYANVVKNSETTKMDGNYIGNDYSIFVDPEHQDFRVKKSAKKELGLDDSVLDEDFDITQIGMQRDMIEVEDSFYKTYPKNGDSGLNAAEVTLSWQKAPFADEYDYTVATDPEMKNVVAYGTTIYSNTIVQGLEKGKSYYWDVKAKNISRAFAKEWNALGVPYMFTTASFDILETDNLKKAIKKAKDYAQTITESDKLGDYIFGTRAKLEEVIKTAEIIAKMTSGEQITINNMESQLKSAVNEAKSSINIAYNGTISASYDDWTTTTPDKIKLIREDEKTIKIDKYDNGGIAGTKIKYNGAGVYTFDMKTSAENGWFAFALRHSTLESDNIYWAPVLNTVFIIVKNDVFELQTRNSVSSGGTLMETRENNGIFKNNEWNRIEFGAIPVASGIYCTLKVNDNIIYQYLDVKNPVRTEGMFAVQPIKDVPMYIREVPDAPTGEFDIPEGVLGGAEFGEIVYKTSASEYGEKGTWNLESEEGFDNEKVRTSSDPMSSASFTVYPQPGGNSKFGTYDVYYYNVPMENGDKKAKVEFTNLYTSYTKTIDTTKGEKGWRKLGTYYFVDEGAKAYMNIKFTPSGAGLLPMSAIKVQKTEDENRNFSEIFYQHAKGAMILKLGNKTAYKDIEEIEMDTEPVVENDRTLVPLRFISEAFDAEVEWKAETKEAVITLGEKTVVFTEGKNECAINGEKKTIDCAARIRDDRMLIPLRALGEALDKEVLWSDEGKLIFIADSTGSIKDNLDKAVKACIKQYEG